MEKYYYLCSMKHLKMMIGLLLLTGCGEATESDDAARQVAQAWGDAYFNCDYHEAEQYVTEESGKWLRFAASNTTESDLELLQRQNATVDADDYFPVATDTLRVVRLKVENYLSPTALGEASRQEEEGVFEVTVVKRADSWQVRMEGLPRSEKQSHD